MRLRLTAPIFATLRQAMTFIMDQILSKLYSLQRRGIVPGLERVRALLEHLDNPHHHLRSIHIAGTNGKGTVSSVLASILMEAGETVGLYTSPHIRRFNERIRINGVPISNEEIATLFHNIEPVADRIGATFFEITTVMALSKFSKQSSICVLECGLGGRFDATNVVTPDVAIITSIDYDHQEWLGSTLEQIAFEKAGIIKPNRPVVVGEKRPHLRQVFERKASEVGASRVCFLDDIPWSYSIVEHTLDGLTMDLSLDNWVMHRLKVPLHGEHQARNVAIALLALKLYWGSCQPNDFEQIIAHGISKVVLNSGLRARIEVVRREPLLVFDVAHNPAGCEALASVVGREPFPPKWNIVFGVMQDKSYREMLNALAPIAAKFYFAAPRTERACNADVLAEVAHRYQIPCRVYSSIADALRAATESGNPTLCTGSFFTIEEAFEYLDQS